MAQDCPICAGSGLLLRNVACPLCDDEPAGPATEGDASTGEHLVDFQERSDAQPLEDGDEAARAASWSGDDAAKCASEEGSDEGTAAPPGEVVWEVMLADWQRVDAELQRMLEDAEASGQQSFEYEARGQMYVVDVMMMTQGNKRTGVVRELRRSVQNGGGSSDEGEDDEFDGLNDKETSEALIEPARASDAQSLCERQANLVERMMSPAVQVPLPAEATEEPAKLSADEVEKVFTDHVEGVRHFLYRDFHGEYSLNFIKRAYSDGIRAFHGTSVHGHLLALLRLIVHHGHAGGAGAANYLTQVAEAFKDCQAVQARVIEQVGLEIRGVVLDFRGLVTKLVGDYKGVALKMLAHDRILRRLASDDGNPTHYENRLTADLGEDLGLNEDDVRRAALDEHAAGRFRRVTGGAREQAAAHARKLFDLDALLKVLTAEINSFSADSSPNSLPRMFLDWAASRLTEKHVVFDEDTCSSVEVGEPLALAILEDLFLGRPSAPTDEVYRGYRLCELFHP